MAGSPIDCSTSSPEVRAPRAGEVGNLKLDAGELRNPAGKTLTCSKHEKMEEGSIKWKLMDPAKTRDIESMEPMSEIWSHFCMICYA